jgi:hypothetical protein
MRPELSHRQRLLNALGGLMLGNRLSWAKAQGLPLHQATQTMDLQGWHALQGELIPLLFGEREESGPQSSIASLRKLEQWLADFDRKEFLRGSSEDFLVDLLILHSFSAEDAGVVGDDQAWDAFEDACMGKGTDLLQLVHYLDECLADSVHPEMEDFIESFVISPDLEDQDNLLAYEEVLESRDLVDAPLHEMIQECRLLAVESAVEPIFTVLFCFLRQGPSPQEFLEILWKFPDDLSDVLPALCCLQAYFYDNEGLGRESSSSSALTIASLCQ